MNTGMEELTTKLLASDFNESEVRSVLARLEFHLSGFEQTECPLKHIFAPGVYAREIFIPKGTLVVGKIHKHDHLNFISVGDVTVFTKDGCERIKAPRTMVSTSGTKRAVYTHEDTVWTTVHITNQTDLAKIEDEIIAKSYDELPALIVQQGVLP